MKELQNHEFREGVKVYSGLKDYYEHTMLVLVDDDLQEVRTFSKLPEYNKRRKRLDALKFGYVYTPQYAEVIDITRTTYNKIMDNFPDYAHTRWQIWD